jgi:uncharacterized protein YkwD
MRNFNASYYSPEVEALYYQEYKREDGHADFEYSRRKFAQLDIEEKQRSELIKQAFDRMNAHWRDNRYHWRRENGKRFFKKKLIPYEKRYEKPKNGFVSEGPLHFVRAKNETEPRQKEKYRFKVRNRSLRVRTSRFLSLLLKVIVGLIVIGLIIWGGGNFIIQTFFPSSVDTSSIESDVFKLINVERANRGLPTLLEDKALVTIAVGWSESLAETGELTHGDFASRIAGIGYSQYSCGEIIAEHGGWSIWTPSLGREFVDMWLNSPKHYEIMMTHSSGYMGVGVCKGRSGFFAVVDFRFS